MKALAIFAAAAGLAACALGNTVTEEPDAFLEYIEATGSQYIDTGVNAETGLKAQIDFAWASGNISTNDWSLLDATIDNSVSDKRRRFLMCHMSQKKPFFGYGKQRGNPSGAVDFVGGERCEIITDMTDTNSLTVAGKQYVGGLVGCITGGTVISNCIAVVEIAATNSYVGGLVGACAGGSAVNRIVNCRADGFVSGNGMVGGFIGYVYAPAVISNCVARGDVRSVSSYYGGFVGRLAHDDATISDCWCSGAVWGTGGDIGSFIGHHVRGTNVNCAVSAQAHAGGNQGTLRWLAGSAEARQVQRDDSDFNPRGTARRHEQPLGQLCADGGHRLRRRDHRTYRQLQKPIQRRVLRTEPQDQQLLHRHHGQVCGTFRQDQRRPREPAVRPTPDWGTSALAVSRARSTPSR